MDSAKRAVLSAIFFLLVLFWVLAVSSGCGLLVPSMIPQGGTTTTTTGSSTSTLPGVNTISGTVNKGALPSPTQEAGVALTN